MKLEFRLCAECCKHGHFYSSDAESGPEVCSKSEALKILDSALRAGRISTDEALKLLQKVQRSKMEAVDSQVPPKFFEMVSNWNIARFASNGYFSSESMHAAYDLDENNADTTVH